MNIVETEFLNIKENNEYVNLIQKVVKQCYETEELNSKIYVSVILTDNSTIKDFNKKYRDIDKETDVLSFPMFEKEDLKNISGEGSRSNGELVTNSKRKENNVIKDKEVEYVLGDIIISVPKIQEQADTYGHSFEREFCYMIVHGFYHLMGYDHMTEEEKSEMRKKEEDILSKMKVTK